MAPTLRVILDRIYQRGRYEVVDSKESLNPTEYDATSDQNFLRSMTHTPPRPYQNHFIIFLKGLVVVFALFGVISMSQGVWQSAVSGEDFKSCNCGNSVAEALAQGCQFDVMTAAWLKPHCIDYELNDEFERSGENEDGSWNYWRNAEKTAKFETSELGALADTKEGFYVSLDWHITHCTFMWRKLLRRRETGITINRRDDQVGHIEHCEWIMKKRIPLDQIATVVGVALNADNMHAKAEPAAHKHKHGMA